MNASMVAGDFLNSLKFILGPLMNLAKFEWKKIDAIKLKASVSFLGQGVIDCVRNAGDALKPAIDVLGGVDDIAIDSLVAAHAEMVNNTITWAHKEIDNLLTTGSAVGIEKEVHAFLQNMHDNVLQRLAS